MTDGLISPTVIAAGAILSWLSAIGLLVAAHTAVPRVNALTERAIVAVIISAFLTLYALVAANTAAGFTWLGPEDALRLLRIGVVGLSFVGPAWLLLWLTGRLGT